MSVSGDKIELGRTGMTGSDVAGCSVLVTGAAGFIGFHLTKRLLATGARVVGNRQRKLLL